MDASFQHVQPGDLITSELFNLLLDEFRKLRDRVTVLEGSPGVGDVAILRLVPESGTVRAGDILQVLGYGFGLSLGACRAFIDGTEVAEFQPGSNDELLVLLVPELVAVANPIPPLGRPATLVVRGPRGTARRDLTLLPPRGTAVGTVEIRFKDVTPNVIAVNQPARFRFAARSLVPAPASVVLAPNFTGVASPAAWQAVASFQKADGTAVTGGRLDLKAGEVDRDFVLFLSAVPAAPAGTVVNYSVNARSDDQLVTGNTGLLSFTVGQAQPPVDPNIETAITNVLPPSALAGDTLTLAPSKTAVVKITAIFKAAGTYVINDPAVTGADWSGTRTTAAKIAVDGATLPFPASLSYTLRAGAAPAADGAAAFTLQREGGLAGPTIRLQLKRGS
jgi:hypothetical protein